MAVADWNADHWDAFQSSFSDDVIADDPWVQALFDLAVYNTEGFGPETVDRKEILEALDMYLYDEYEVIFEDVFDWEHFRETYG